MTQAAAQQVPGDYEVATIEALIHGQWSLQDYLAWLGRRDRQEVLEGWWVGSLTRDADHWARAGVVTAADLAAYLDAEVERERRKDAMAGDDDWEPLLGRSDRCTQCGDLADFTATGGQLCVPCHRAIETAYEDDDPYRDLRAILLTPAERDEEDERLGLSLELGPVLDVSLCANRLARFAASTGWFCP